MLLGYPSKPSDRHNVLSVVNYDDGHREFVLIPKYAFPGRDLEEARKRQARGELPDGAIVSVTRAR